MFQSIEPLPELDEGDSADVAEAVAALATVEQPLALIDLTTKLILAANVGAAELFNSSPSALAGRSLLDMIVEEGRSDAEHAQELLRSGQIHGFQAHRIYKTVHGAAFEADVWVRRLDIADAESIALVVIVPASVHHANYSTVPATRHHVRSLIAVTDHGWSVQHASAETETVLDMSSRDLIGTSFLAVVHPDDMANVLFAIADAVTSKRAAVLKARLGTSDRRWRDTTCSVTALCDHSPPRLCIVATLCQPTTPTVATRDGSRTEQLEQTLRRIAFEVRAATSAPRVCDLLESDSADKLQQLSSRQWDIVSRLSRGESPSTIAAALYVSPSTVRNQLSAIYRKLGVHSQLELLALLRTTVAPDLRNDAH